MSDREQNGTSAPTARDCERKFLASLGLCVRAGKVIFGVPMICDAMRRGGASASMTVFEASDTSDNTHKRISDKCKFYKVKHIQLPCDGETLAAALGKTAHLAAIAVTDRQMSAMAEQHLSARSTAPHNP